MFLKDASKFNKWIDWHWAGCYITLQEINVQFKVAIIPKTFSALDSKIRTIILIRGV